MRHCKQKNATEMITLLSNSSALEAKPSSHWIIRRHNCAVRSPATNWQASKCDVGGNCNELICMSMRITSSMFFYCLQILGKKLQKQTKFSNETRHSKKMHHQDELFGDLFSPCKVKTNCTHKCCIHTTQNSQKQPQ